jgi:putative transposase
MAVRGQFGHLGRGAARGVQPETNGVIERFFRTLKEQVVYGRVFQTLDEVRDTVRAFIARYNAEWLIEKNGHLSPQAMRRKHDLATIPMAA